MARTAHNAANVLDDVNNTLRRGPRVVSAEVDWR
jgi:hypothetical protein